MEEVTRDGGTRTSRRWLVWAWLWLVYFVKREWRGAPDGF